MLIVLFVCRILDSVETMIENLVNMEATPEVDISAESLSMKIMEVCNLYGITVSKVSFCITKVSPTNMFSSWVSPLRPLNVTTHTQLHDYGEP